MPITIVTNAPDAAKTLERINAEIASNFRVLYRNLGAVLQKNVQDRIQSEDDGKWAKASKWVQAKKGTNHKVLDGAEAYVKFDVDKNGVSVYGDTPGEWTLTQHDEGFENEVPKAGRIEIDIVDPGPLGLRPGTSKFSWEPKTTSLDRTPARKIWPTEAEAVSIITPIYSRWLQATVNRAVQGTGVVITGSVF